MNDNYIIWKAFDANSVETIKNLIETGEWIPGYSIHVNTVNTRLATHSMYNQNNLNYLKVRGIVYQAMDQSQEFSNFCFPKTSGQILICKYTEGEYLGIHEDDPSNGEFSTTIFLNDPATYSGGELCLYINGKNEKIKLPMGYAITYSTGIYHQVNKVESGERLVIALWTKTLCSDPLHRSILRDLYRLNQLFPSNNDVHQTIESYLDTPFNLIHSIRNKILRSNLNK